MYSDYDEDENEPQVQEITPRDLIGVMFGAMVLGVIVGLTAGLILHPFVIGC